jgi:hypothetical protein
VVVVAIGLAAAGPARALSPTVTKIEKNTDGTITYHFKIKVDEGTTAEAGAAGAKDANPDFFTIYNFYGFIEDSVKTPEGWKFSSEEFGKTPALNGYPLVLPVDVPGTPNLTWTCTKPVKAGTEVTGFSAKSRVAKTTDGMYSAQVTRRAAAIEGLATEPGKPGSKPTKEGRIGTITKPAFLLEIDSGLKK